MKSSFNLSGVLSDKVAMDINFGGQMLTNADNEAICQTFLGVCHGEAYFKLADVEYNVFMFKGKVVKVVKDDP